MTEDATYRARDEWSGTASWLGRTSDAVVVVDSEVRVLGHDGVETVDPDDPVTAVLPAAGRLVASTDSGVAAFERDGSVAWTRAVPTDSGVAVTDGTTFAVTGDALRGWTVADGEPVVETGLPHDDIPGEVTIGAGGNAVAIGRWSFVTVFESGGDHATEWNLDGTVEDVAVGGGVVAAVLRHGEVVVGTVDSGAIEYRFDVDASGVDVTDEGRVVVASRSGWGTTTDGEVTYYAEEPTTAVAVEAGGDFLAVATGGRTTVYDRVDGATDIEADELTLSAGETGTASVEIVGDRSPGDVLVRSDCCAVDPAALVVEPGELASLTVDAPDEECEGRVSLWGARGLLGAFPVMVTDRSTVDASVTATRVDRDSLVLSVETDEPGSIRGPSGSTAVPAGEPTEVEVPLASTPESVSFETDSGETVPLDVPSVDGSIDIDLAAAGGYVDATVDHSYPVAVRNELTVAMPERTVDRELSVDIDERVRLTVPPGSELDDDPVTASLSGTDVSVTERLTVTGTHVEQERPSNGATDGTGRSSSESRTGGRPGESADSERVSPDEYEDDRRSEAASSAAEPQSLDLERRVSATSASVGEAVKDRLVVVNPTGSTATNVTLTCDGDTVDIDAVPAGERVTFERALSRRSPGELLIDEATVDADIGTASAPVERVSVTTDSLSLDASLEARDDGAVARIGVTNHADHPVDLGRVGVTDVGSATLDTTIRPGESRVGARRLGATAPDDATQTGAVEWYVDDQRVREPVLFEVTRADDADDDPDVEVTVDEETHPVASHGSLVVDIRNVGNRVLTGVDIVASGANVSDLLYAGRETFDELAPGETVTHFVDLDADPLADEATVELDIELEDETVHAELCGPTVEDGDDVEASVVDAWSVDAESSRGTEASPDADVLRTPFERVD